MHGRKEFLIAAAIAALVHAPAANAQKDAAEKAREGSIEHWIEYYKAEQRKLEVPSGQQQSAEPDAVKRSAPESPPGAKAGQK